jgi:hypothetical protein
MNSLPLRLLFCLAIAITGTTGFSQLPKIADDGRRKITCTILSPELYGVRAPFGSGDRTIEICINKCGYSPDDLDVVVFYSKTELELSSVSVNPSAVYGHGKAKYIRTVGNILRYEYTFPHSGFKDINGPVGSEYKIVQIPSRDNSLNPQKVYYRIGVKRRSSNTLTELANTASFSMPDPITIALLGDSFAAGEGAPIQQASMFTDPTQLWNDNDSWTTTDVPCHRSYLSGQAQAAEKFRKQNKKLAIAIKHLACSGATISELALQKQNASGVQVPLQFQLIKNWLQETGYSQLDVMLMSIGGNDAGFAQAIVDFMLNPIGNFSDNEDAQNRYSDPNHSAYPFNDMKQAYSQLNNDIWNESFFKMSAIGKPVILQGYPSACKGPNGNPWCGQTADWAAGFNNTVGECWGILEQDDKPNEFRDLHNIIVTNLNNTMAQAAQENDWSFVDVMTRAGTHGLSNCDEPYFNTIGQSWSRQGDVSGFVHPNSNGYTNIYVDPLYSSIRNQVLRIRAYWESYNEDDCTSVEAARLSALRQLLLDQAKRTAKAKSLKKAYPVIKSYSSYRMRYASEVDKVLQDYKKGIQEGRIKPVAAPKLSTDIINVDFSDKFSVTKTGALK